MQGSPTSATRAIRTEPDTTKIVNACAAAAEDLAMTRQLADALDRENAALKERLETARHTEALLTELNETRRSEAEALRVTIAAKNETIAAKDAVIAKQDALVTTLKNRKSSPWKRIGDILIGVAVATLLK